MARFRKKPVVVEAWQFTEETKDRVLHNAQAVQMNVTHAWDENNAPCIRIPTLEGEMTCSLGDWIIVEPFPTDWRRLYPCKPDIFEATYEAVNEETEPDWRANWEERMSELTTGHKY